jgi:hypothetical protein
MLKVVPRDCIPQDKSSKGKWKWKRCFIKFQKLLKLRISINIFIPFQNCNFSCSCNKFTKRTIKFETIFRHVARIFYLNLHLFSEFLQCLLTLFDWEGVGTSKIRTSKGQDIESIFRMIRTSKVKKIRTLKVFSECRKWPTYGV